MKIETLFQPIQYLILSVTEGCNLRCNYCKVGASTQSSPKMSLETAKRAIQLLIENSLARKVTVNLHGGEPLLMSDEWINSLVCYGNDLAKHCSKRIIFPITTNGTLVTQDRLSKLLKNGVGFSISCDGPPQINDLMRQKGDDVERAIHLFRQTNFQPISCMVIHQKNYDKMKQTMNWYAEQGISTVVTNFVTPQGRGTDGDLLSPHQMLESSKQAIEHMFETGLSVLSKPLIGEIRWFVNGDQDADTMSCYKSECVAGKTIASVAVNGDINPCAAIDLDDFVIGNIHDSEINDFLYRDVLSRFHKKTKTFSKCQDCPIKHICTHGCTSACDKSPTYKENYCSYTHLLWDYLSDNREISKSINDIYTARVKHSQNNQRKAVHTKSELTNAQSI